MKEFWDDRYKTEEYVYGKEPNEYLKSQLQKLPAGTILFPAEGEGRNAVYAAKLGWNVSAFDISPEGKKKAMRLAEGNNVTIDYRVGDLQGVNYRDGQFDAIAMIYNHFPPEIMSSYHQSFDRFLRKGGYIIFEAFSKRHIEYNSKDERVGGPKDVDMLYSVDEIKSWYRNYDFLELAEIEIDLNEGNYHFGKGSVVRCFGRKK